MPVHYAIPQVPKGYALNTAKGALSIVVPEATVNKITNSSFELNDTRWTAQGIVAFDRILGSGYRGAYALEINPNSTGDVGARYTFGASVALSGLHTLSFDFRGAASQKYRAVVNGTTIATFYGRGATHYFRVICPAVEMASAGSATIDILRDSSTPGTSAFWIDGVQFEEKGYATTYCDGDMQGFVVNELAYYWDGQAHGSTSQRLATTRTGGRLRNLQDLGAFVTAVMGLGLVPVTILGAPVLAGGSFVQGSTPRERPFSLTTVINGQDAYDLDRQVGKILEYLNPFALNHPQPLRLRYESYHCNGTTPQSLPCEIDCYYTGGMEGVRDNVYQERAAPGFVMPAPWIVRDGNNSAELDVQNSVADADSIAQRSRLGVWDDVAGGVLPAAADVNALVQGSGGRIYVGGDFTSAGGVANTTGIARYERELGAWFALGTGAAGGAVEALAVGPDGAIYAGGSFTSMGGVANTRFLAKLTPSTGLWSSIGTTLGGTSIQALAFGPAGILYAGGSFTTIGGVAANRIASYNGTAWSAMGTGASDNVYSIAVSQDGAKVWIGGQFLLAGGVANTVRIALWTVSTAAWSPLSTGANSGFVYALLYGMDGMLYVGGTFTTLGGTAVLGVGAWNGTSFSQLGAGTGGGSSVYALMQDVNGDLYVGGTLLNLYGAANDSYIIWNGSTYISGDAQLPGSAAILSIVKANDGALWFGFDQTGTATVAGITTIDYAGTAPSYPRIMVAGPSTGSARLHQVRNTTTGVGVFFNLLVAAGETITIDFDPRSPTYGISSSQRGNVISSMLAGSNLADWQLQPDQNTISVYAEGSTMTASMTWRVRYAAIEHARVV